MSLTKKVASTVIAAGALLVTLAPSAFANAEVAGNGWGSRNTIVYVQKSETEVNQSNDLTVDNHVVSVATTGNNSGDDIHTGNATSTVSIEVSGGNNIAHVPDCGCPQHGNYGIYGNGGKSYNDIYVIKEESKEINQDSNLDVSNSVYSKSDTGGNENSSDHSYKYDKYKWWWNNYNNSTGGNIHTGDAHSVVTIDVSGGSNIIH